MASERYLYALADWTVERRRDGWYFSRSRNRHNKAEFKGPYCSEFSVTLMIARALRKEILERHQEPAEDKAA